VLVTRDSSENTLRERESLKTGQDSNFDDGDYHKNENGDNGAEEKAQGSRVKPVGFWDPSLAITRKWVLLHWVRTSMFSVAATITLRG
jgi:hypothetical protein